MELICGETMTIESARALVANILHQAIIDAKAIKQKPDGYYDKRCNRKEMDSFLMSRWFEFLCTSINISPEAIVNYIEKEQP